MLTNPMEVLRTYPVRKTKKQKQAFRDAVEAYAASVGYPSRVERGSFGCRNLILGDPESARYLVTAHYDTCARLPFPNFITPCNFLPFLGYQLLVMVLLLFTAFTVGILAGIAASSVAIGCAVGYLCIWVLLGLMLAGPANPSNANDNTSGVVTLLEIARTLPENQRHKVCFVLFDLEEAGLLGSASYRKAHRKATDSQLVLNLDLPCCGDRIAFVPTKELKKDRKKLTDLYRACGYFGKKSLLVQEKKVNAFSSEQRCFPYAAGIHVLKKGKLGWRTVRSSAGEIPEPTNINILRAALTSFLCCDAGK